MHSIFGKDTHSEYNLTTAPQNNRYGVENFTFQRNLYAVPLNSFHSFCLGQLLLFNSKESTAVIYEGLYAEYLHPFLPGKLLQTWKQTSNSRTL